MLIFLSFGYTATAQSVNHKLIFNPVFENFRLILNESFYTSGNNDTLVFGTLKFYISGIEYLKDNETVWKETDSYHLIDVSDKKSLLVLLSSPSTISFNKIKFSIGIDSVTNVSGAMGGDLDPAKGMYWTWHSGYINFKMEGQFNHHAFQYHLGGYHYPYSTFQTIVLNTNTADTTEIIFDLSKFFDAMDPIAKSHIMSPGKDAAALSAKVKTIFTVKVK